MERKMKRIFILVATLVSFVSSFAEGIHKEPHSCLEYAKAISPDATVGNIRVWDVLDPLNQLDNTFIPNWFDHIEFADDFSDYSQEFLQQHSGHSGTIVYFDGEYKTRCSGTLIGENYFITAGHCAHAENIGVLFGYQIEDRGGNNNFTGLPRVSREGYLDDNGIYRYYGEAGSDYLNFMEHPAYFPINRSFQYRYNVDYSVENGWANVGWLSRDYMFPQAASTMTWPNDDPNGEKLGMIDYAIYKLDKNSDLAYPGNVEDPWPWRSENNQSSQNTISTNLVLPWILPDNTNGFRGWARVNTSVLQENDPLSIIGFPGAAGALKVINTGSVVNGQDYGLAFSYEEDILIFKDADLLPGNSGSSVIDSRDRLAGVAVWTDCAPGGTSAWDQILLNILNNPDELRRPAKNYATPMWKICRASRVVKNAANDQNCNGRNDLWDFILSLRFIRFEFLGIDGFLLNNLALSSSASEVQNYKYDINQKKLISETKVLPPYTYQVAWSNNGDFFYVAIHNNSVYLFKNGAALGEISNYPALSGSSTLVKGNDIYLAGGYVAGGIQYLSNGNQNNSGNTVQLITKISSDGQNGYNFSIVATLPSDFEDIRIFSLGNDIYVSGNTDGHFVIYKLLSNNTLIPASDASQPVRKDYNLTASDGKIIVSGGATDYISTVLAIEEREPYPEGFAVYNNIIMLEPDVSNNWVTVAENMNNKIIMLSVTAIDDGNLVIVNPFITAENSMQKFVLDLSDIPINGEELNVSFESHPVGFCLSESNDNLVSGLEQSGECVPFTHPWYNSFSAGATVYSLDGKGDRLYVGTNNAIKVYDISDPTSPVLVSSFSTSSRVNDLEVYGDVLFAATNGGLYKLDASNDTLTQTLFVSAFLNSQYKVEVYNGKLYVGEDNGIKVRDLDTLSVLTSVNNGSVLDFAIENGEIGLYKDALFSPVEIRDADTLALKANEFFGCFEIEVGSSDGRFYLSCDDETYRFEDDGDGGISFTELSGDIRELQDVYTYNGYTYFYDENTIWISTSNDVPALCGNGIVEGDEVCDGGQIDCEELDSNYVSGTATCNATCDGYNTNNCSDDGW